MISRTEALDLLEKGNVKGPLLEHSLASEAVMAALAAKLGENVEIWSLAGLLHDLDYPATSDNPQEHGLRGADTLVGLLPEDALCAIVRHNGEINGNPPSTKFDYALRCGESITGLVAAAALMRPTGYEGMGVKSIKKKLKDKAFAANVSRENIRQCEDAGVPLDEFLALAIDAMARLHSERAD